MAVGRETIFDALVTKVASASPEQVADAAAAMLENDQVKDQVAELHAAMDAMEAKSVGEPLGD